MRRGNQTNNVYSANWVCVCKYIEGDTHREDPENVYSANFAEGVPGGGNKSEGEAECLCAGMLLYVSCARCFSALIKRPTK